MTNPATHPTPQSIAANLRPELAGGSTLMGPMVFVLVSMLSTSFIAHYNAPKFYQVRACVRGRRAWQGRAWAEAVDGPLTNHPLHPTPFLRTRSWRTARSPSSTRWC